MNELFGDSHRVLQDEFSTRDMADRIIDLACSDTIEDEHRGFIESRDMFFLASVDANGSPTVSYKGGDVGFLRILDNRTLMFPSYDGNGMYLSMGNIADNSKIGLLLIDFENPHRLRIQGTAELSRDSELVSSYKEAELVVKVTVEQIFTNCPRYIHRYQRIAQSRYIPKDDGQTPMATWKRIDIMQDVIPEKDKAKVDAEGGTMPIETWFEKVQTGAEDA